MTVARPVKGWSVATAEIDTSEYRRLLFDGWEPFSMFAYGGDWMVAFRRPVTRYEAKL